jgi:hypothetical protein
MKNSVVVRRKIFLVKALSHAMDVSAIEEGLDAKP